MAYRPNHDLCPPNCEPKVEQDLSVPPRVPSPGPGMSQDLQRTPATLPTSYHVSVRGSQFNSNHRNNEHSTESKATCEPPPGHKSLIFYLLH